MTDDKSRNDAGGFFDNEDEDEFLSENTVVDTEILKKLSDRIQADDPSEGAVDGPELLEEMVMDLNAEQSPKQPHIDLLDIDTPEPPIPGPLDEVPPPLAIETPESEPEPPKKAPVPTLELDAPDAPAAPKQPIIPTTMPPKAALKEAEISKVDRLHKLLEEPEDVGEALVSEEKTIILSDEDIDGLPEVKGAKLVVLEGPDEGNSYKIEFNEIFVGRGVENDFVVADRTMSRKHFRIRRRFDEYIIVDLQSGNGVRLNREKITEAPLSHEDEIVVGRTKMQFIDLAVETTDQKPVAAVVAEPSTRAKAEAEAVAKAKAADIADKKAAPAPPTPEATTPKKQEKQKEAPQAKEVEDEDRPALSLRPSRSQFEPITAQRRGAQIEPEEKPSSSAGLIIGIIAVLAIVLALIYMQQESSVEPVVEKTPPAPQVDPQELQRSAQIKKLLDQGSVLMQSKFFAKSIDKYNEVLALDNGNATAEMQKTFAQREITNGKALEEGKRLLSENAQLKAAIRLKVIGEKSVYYPEAQALLNKVEDMKHDEEVQKGKALLDEKKYDEAITAFAAILATKPGHAGATQYKKIAEQEKEAAIRSTEEQKQRALAQAEGKRMEAETRRQQKEQRARERREKADREAEAARRRALEDKKRKEAEERRRALEERKKQDDERKRKALEEKRSRDAEAARKREEAARKRAEEQAKKRLVSGMGDLDRGYSLYKSGDLDKAVGELTTIKNGRGDKKTISKAGAVIKKIKSFKKVRQEALAAHKAKDPAKAIPKLKSALKLDRTITSGSSFSKNLLNDIADMYFLIGNSAKQKKQWAKAKKAYIKALKFSPGHGQSMKGIESLAKEAEKLYYRGVAVKDSDPDKAEALWESVLRMVPSSNKWHKKAKAGLEDL